MYSRPIRIADYLDLVILYMLNSYYLYFYQIDRVDSNFF